MEKTSAPATATLAPTAPQMPHTAKEDLWAPSVLISLAVALTGLLGWLMRTHYKLAHRDRDLDEVMKQSAVQKTQLDALEMRMQNQESQGRLHGEVMTRQDRLLEKIEEKLDRLYELVSKK